MNGDKELAELLEEVQKSQTPAWRAGYAAYGVGDTDNPHVAASAREEWFRGYELARAVGRAAVDAIDRFDADNP